MNFSSEIKLHLKSHHQNIVNKNPWKKTPSMADPLRSCIKYWHPEKLHLKLFLVHHVHCCSIISPPASHPILVVTGDDDGDDENEDKEENYFI